MGLSNNAHTDSIPILFIAATAAFLAYIRHLLFSLLPTSAASSSSSPPPPGLASGGLVILADFLNSNRAFSYDPSKERTGGEDCVVCLSSMRGGEKIRRLNCCHVFHSNCLDGWFDQMKLSCPLCRSPLTGRL